MLKPRRSEMLELFSEEADKCGLLPKQVKLAKKDEDTPAMKKYKSETNPRMGSDDISTIEALYGVKPDGQNYDWNIIEEAHPNSVVTMPSYDRINGLVENNNERQSIILNRMTKFPAGFSENTKYARKELIGELVRVANFLENKDEEDLAIKIDEILISLE